MRCRKSITMSSQPHMMKIDMQKTALKKAVDLIKRFNEVAAIGLSGSHVEGIEDEHSDLDICIYAREKLPPKDVREREYRNSGIEKLIYLDLDFEVIKADGVVIDGVECGFCWMSIPFISKFLSCLSLDFGCDEFLPGGLLKTRPIFDPKGIINKLKRIVPSYPEPRAIHRIRIHLEKAHHLIFGIGRLKAAASRNDYYDFLKIEYDVLDSFMTALFALNRQWFCDEKRLLNRIKNFELKPDNCSERLESIIKHHGENIELEKCLTNVCKLLIDLQAISKKTYPKLNVFKSWE